MATCPNGHQSVSEDWCDVCGHRMAAPAYGHGFPPTAGEPTAQAELCPQCRTPREAMAPFCEECRYNFLTRTPTPTSYAAQPSAADPGPAVPPPPGPPPGPPTGGLPTGAGQGGFAPDGFDYRDSRPSRVNRPAEPLQGEDDWMLPPPGREAPAPEYGQDYGQEYVQEYGHQPMPQPQPGYPQPQQQYQPYPTPQQPPQPPQPQNGTGAWSATIAPDRVYFMAMMQRSGPEAAGLNLPAFAPEQHLPLSGGQITIGRRRVSTGESPDIDLSVPPEDPGVSHQHAVLVQQPDLSWAVVDQNSTNGTTINGGEEPIQPYVPVPLADGDRVHVGAWTTITVRRG